MEKQKQQGSQQSARSLAYYFLDSSKLKIELWGFMTEENLPNFSKVSSIVALKKTVKGF